MSNEVLICAAQMAPNSEEKRQNVDRILSLMEQAAAQGASIIAFPECALTPFFTLKNTKAFDQYFEPADSPLIREIGDAAKANHIAVVLPYAEASLLRHYNSAAIIGSDGELLGQYRKAHIPGAFVADEVKNFEKLYFTPGDLGFPCFDVGGMRIGVQICYDRHFPEGFRSLALSGAQVIFNVTGAGAYGKAWRSDSWELMLRARAFENGVYIVGVNKVGLEYGQDYFGQSLVASPLGGEIIGSTKDHGGDELLVQSIELDQINEARKRLPALRDLRPELYRDIYRPVTA